MLKKRIIPCLDVSNGRVVKGINFEGLKDAGDAVELARRYMDEGADELVFLDITATTEKRKTLLELIRRVAAEISIPFTVGGGIRSCEDAKLIIGAGADKVSINSAAVHRPELISEIAAELGRQCVVLAIDTQPVNNEWHVFTEGGRTRTGLEATSWARTGEALGAGEILLTSISSDGMCNGFSLDITAQLCDNVSVPVIASGGAGALHDFAEVFTKTGATGALAASVFHFGRIAVPELKQFLSTQNIPVRI